MQEILSGDRYSIKLSNQSSHYEYWSKEFKSKAYDFLKALEESKRLILKVKIKIYYDNLPELERFAGDLMVPEPQEKSYEKQNSFQDRDLSEFILYEIKRYFDNYINVRSSIVTGLFTILYIDKEDKQELSDYNKREFEVKELSDFNLRG